jgi:ABC-type Mn2+/Zn2+ transport system ATPase subunit
MKPLLLNDLRCAWSETWWQSPGERFEGVSIEVDPGEWCAVVGDNGLGKSTLLHGIAGSCPCVVGTAECNGHTLRQGDLNQRFDLGIQFVAQEPKCSAVWRFSDIECLAFAHRPGLFLPQAVKDLKRTLREHGILSNSDETLFSPKAARTIASILACPSVLLLDEAGEHLRVLDANGGRKFPPDQFYALVKKLLPATAVLFVEHNQELASKFADKAIFASIRKESDIDVYEFKIDKVEKLASALHNRVFQKDPRLPRLPLLELDRSVKGHVRLALSASVLNQELGHSLLKSACEYWPYLNETKKVDVLSGGQKIILQAVVEILAFGLADLQHERLQHVSSQNLLRLGNLQNLASSRNV